LTCGSAALHGRRVTEEVGGHVAPVRALGTEVAAVGRVTLVDLLGAPSGSARRARGMRPVGLSRTGRPEAAECGLLGLLVLTFTSLLVVVGTGTLS